ncbi:MAG: cryptochrome/photolyase family protein [Phycisphaerae bacterium]|nr:cryptochrome/photolyase family protein [Phycisphaerae bacterium]
MSAFREALEARRGETRAGRRLVYVPYDQLTKEVGPLAEGRADTTALFVESREWLSRRPYHRQKLATVLLNQRAFALELADAGFDVRYEIVDGPISDALSTIAREARPAIVMRPAERELRAELAPLAARGLIDERPNETWLTTPDDLAAAGQPFRMDRFYQAVRRRTGILMERGKPVGGKFSFDAENRKPWNGTPPAPEPPRFRTGPLRAEVEALVRERFAAHPGTLDVAAIPATRSEADRLWSWAKSSCLPHFGPYEDAMSSVSRGLFHTRLTPILNLARLLPRDLVDDAAGLDIPLASKEGFIRQVLGWREFVQQVHAATDGFRTLPTSACAARPGDGGFARWSGAEWRSAAAPQGVDGGSLANALDADTPLPPAWWGRESGLRCLDETVAAVWAEGYSHHITRLMVLANLATLLGVSPRELTDWFWVAYADAYDWVVEPNVLGMGSFAVGDLLTTKPYVSGAAYIAKMSDHCGSCRFDPKSTCPVTRLYWDFLRRNEPALRDNPRMTLPLASMRARGDADRAADRATFLHVRDVLVRGERLRPDESAAPVRTRKATR